MDQFTGMTKILAQIMHMGVRCPTGLTVIIPGSTTAAGIINNTYYIKNAKTKYSWYKKTKTKS